MLIKNKIKNIIVDLDSKVHFKLYEKLRLVYWMIVSMKKVSFLSISQLLFFKIRYLKTKFFFSYSMIKYRHYSQIGQDGYIYETFFKNKQEGIFCDVGANEPIFINNTYLFEKKGWKGFAFDPLPRMKKLWKQKRPDALFFPVGISNKNSILELNVSSFDANSSFSNVRDKYDKLTCKVERLDKIFTDNNIFHIDFMSIDTEGFEMNVLESIDFEKVYIGIIIIENHPSSTDYFNYGSDSIRKFMYQKGYKFYSRISSYDDVFVSNNFKGKI